MKTTPKKIETTEQLKIRMASQLTRAEAVSKKLQKQIDQAKKILNA